ncbi:MAG: lytic transglycosylase domain-containing protein [Pelagimonas sp.]|jgi:hypothetical protein|nr:lytic transglycosylase domain-containing protein [Pelagimonas sp.]
MFLRAAVVLAVLATPILAQPDPFPRPAPDAVSPQAVPISLRPQVRPRLRRVTIPTARWDKIKGSRSWTRAVLSSLRGHAHRLTELTPRDITDYCPAYPTASRADREAFWVGLVSSLAWHESTHRPAAVGGGGRWYGLVQIYPDTARRYGCKAKSGAALKDPEDNLRCGLRIMAVTVPRDMVISRNMRGVAADWGPFHSKRKRQDMMAWTRSQPYCSGLSRSLRPVARPRPDPTPAAPPDTIDTPDTSAS